MKKLAKMKVIIAFVTTIILSSSGCKNAIFRPQSPDDLAARLQAEAEDVRYVGDVCRIWGLNFAKAEAVALANGLAGTGSDPANNSQRSVLLDEMKAFNVDSPNEILKSKNTSMILVQGWLPPGVQKGDRFDILVAVIDRSKTTSLDGGYCVETRLRPFARLGNRTRSGHAVGIAQGPILTNQHFEQTDTGNNKVTGVILGGGVCTENRKLGLTVGSEEASIRMATQVANAINKRFAIYDESGKVGVAVAKSHRNIELAIPVEYKHNMSRFLGVAMNISFDHPKTTTKDRVDKLESQLNQPALAQRAALRLEGIGPDSTEALRRGLNHPDAEVRFYAAEALAYLGKDFGVKHLEKAARDEPAFRWHALTALASLKETKSGTALANLMHAADHETRYGAFRAMRARSPQDPLVKGKQLGEDAFRLHIVPSPAKPLVHISGRKRREIVVFNGNQTFGDQFLFVKSGITARTTGPNSAEIKVYLRNDGDKIIKCSNRVGDVIERLARLGCDYACMIDLLLEAQADGNINSQVVLDAVPKANRKKRNRWEVNELPGAQDTPGVVSHVPELFRSADDQTDRNGYAGQPSELAQPAESNLDQMPKQKTGFFDKIKNPFKRLP